MRGLMSDGAADRTAGELKWHSGGNVVPFLIDLFNGNPAMSGVVDVRLIASANKTPENQDELQHDRSSYRGQ